MDATIASLPPPSTAPHDYACVPFASETEYDEYIESISPKRELVCPITQEVLRDPVVAEDGYTYERTALLRWFSMGRTRSPVTNSIMGGHNVFPNLALQGMAHTHREKLGTELLNRCLYIYKHNGSCPDNGSRIAALLDAGADSALRLNRPSEPYDGNTCLLTLIQCRNLQLSRMVLEHENHHHVFDSAAENDEEEGAAAAASVSTTGIVTIPNRSGVTCTAAVEEIVRTLRYGEERKEWKLFLEEIKRREVQEKQRMEEMSRNRQRANEEHRERQRTLAASTAPRAQQPNVVDVRAVHGLGSMQNYGWGYFPSLATLQFQSGIPPPSASTAAQEEVMKEKLRWILMGVGFWVALVFLLC